MIGLPEAGKQLGIEFSTLIFNQIQIIGSLVGSSRDFYKFLDFCG